MTWWYVVGIVWAASAGFVAGILVGLLSKPAQLPPAPPPAIKARDGILIDMKRISRN